MHNYSICNFPKKHTDTKLTNCLFLLSFDCVLKSGTFGVPELVLPRRGTAWHKSWSSRKSGTGGNPTTGGRGTMNAYSSITQLQLESFYCLWEVCRFHVPRNVQANEWRVQYTLITKCLYQTVKTEIQKNIAHAEASLHIIILSSKSWKIVFF